MPGSKMTVTVRLVRGVDIPFVVVTSHRQFKGHAGIKLVPFAHDAFGDGTDRFVSVQDLPVQVVGIFDGNPSVHSLASSFNFSGTFFYTILFAF
jgi:hypothetical protein